MPYDIVRDGNLVCLMYCVNLDYLFYMCVGIEENFKESCKVVKERMETLMLKVKVLEQNRARGWYIPV